MKSKKRFWKSWLALLLAVILSLQGTEPVFVQAKEISENKIRDVDFSKPEALTAEEAGIEDKTNDSADDSKETRKKTDSADENGETTEQPEDNLETGKDLGENQETDTDGDLTLEDQVQENPEEETTTEIELKEPADYYPIPEEPEGELVDYDEMSKTYKNGEGTYTTQLGGYLGIYEDENGELQPVENELIEPDTRSEGDVFVNKANDYLITLPKNITENAGIVLDKDGNRLEIIPLSGDYSNSVVRDNAVLYNQVQEGIDVQYTVIDNNVKEDIVLNNPVETAEFQYEILSEGLTAEEQDGVIYLYEEGSTPAEAVYILEAPVMIDAADVVSTNIVLSLQEEEGRTILTVSPNQEWLNSGERQYPVRIDPTTVNVTRENFSMIGVEQGSPTTYVGDNNYPYVGYDDGIKSMNLEDYGTMHMICRTFVKVNYDFSTIPKDSKIDSATFSVSQMTNYSEGASQFGLYRVDSEWGEFVTWEDQPMNHTFMDVQNASGAINAYIDYNVKDLVNDWIQGIHPNYGMVLKAIDEASGLEAAMQCEVLNNRNSPYGPKMTIEWSTAEDPYLRDMPIEDLTINLRPMTEKNIKGKLNFDGVFADGVSKSKSRVEYYLSPNEDKEKHHETDAYPLYKFPDNTEFLKVFPEATKYLSKDSNWQSDLYAKLEMDKLFKIKAVATKDGESSGEKESDSFVIYKVKQFDTFPKIAKYYGVPLSGIMKDNGVQDALVMENNTIFIRNPKTNVPYNPPALTDTDKMKIDGALMGRGLHCEFGFEPVNLNTGNFFMEQKDAKLQELDGEFSILRSYNSKATDQNSYFGRGWSFVYEQALIKMEDDSILYTRGDGSYLFLTPNGDGTYSAPDGYDYQLKERLLA